MNTPAKNTDHSSEDIDLLLLLERSLAFLKKFRWLFILAFIAGVGAGIYYYKSRPKIYKSRMILHSFLLTNQELIAIGDNWNALLKKNERGSLSGIFNCSESLLGRVKEIKATEIQKIFTPTNPNGFYIDVIVTDNNILDSLQKGIVYGYENTPYIRQRVDIKKANLAELIAKTTSEIARLDSTKNIVQDIMNGKGKSSSALVIDGSSINRQLIEMNQKLLSFKEDFQFANAIQVFQPFSVFRNPAGPSLIVSLSLGIIFFLALAYLFALFSSINSKLKGHRLQDKG